MYSYCSTTIYKGLKIEYMYFKVSFNDPCSADLSIYAIDIYTFSKSILNIDMSI